MAPDTKQLQAEKSECVMLVRNANHILELVGREQQNASVFERCLVAVAKVPGAGDAVCGLLIFMLAVVDLVTLPFIFLKSHPSHTRNIIHAARRTRQQVVEDADDRTTQDQGVHLSSRHLSFKHLLNAGGSAAFAADAAKPGAAEPEAEKDSTDRKQFLKKAKLKVETVKDQKQAVESAQGGGPRAQHAPRPTRVFAVLG